MNTKDNRQNAHDMIDHVFQDLLPARGLSERPGQLALSHLMLADAIHRSTGRRLILPDANAVIIDEAHKLPETARQMFGITLEAGDIRGLIRSLRREKFVLAAESLAELSAPLLRLMEQPFDTEKSFQDFSRFLAAPARNLHIVQSSSTACSPNPLTGSFGSCPPPWSCSPKRILIWCFTPWRTGKAAPCFALWPPT